MRWPSAPLRPARALALALAALLAPGGCAAPPPPPVRTFPSLSDLAPAEPIRAPVPEAAAGRASGVSATLTRLTLPLEVSIEPAWVHVDENVLPPLTRGVLRANGLRAGVVPRERLGAFLDGLPPVWSDRAFRVFTAGLPQVVRQSPPLIRVVTADLTVPPYAPRLEELLGRRAALVMELQPGPAGLSVTLTPLHQKPEASVLPRSAAEKQLDGRLFTELALRLRIPPGGHAVVGLAREPAGLPTAAELLAEQAALPPAIPAPALAPGEALPPPARARLDPPPLPAHLGRALFTAPAERRGEPQVLLIITP